MKQPSKVGIALVAIGLLAMAWVSAQFMKSAWFAWDTSEPGAGEQSATEARETKLPLPVSASPERPREHVARLPIPKPETIFRARETHPEGRQDPAAERMLQVLRDQQDDQLRARTLHQAMSSGVELATNSLVELALHDRSAEVRFLALQGLTDRAEAGAVARLALNDPSHDVRTKAEEILLQVMHETGQSPEPVH